MPLSSKVIRLKELYLNTLIFYHDMVTVKLYCHASFFVFCSLQNYGTRIKKFLKDNLKYSSSGEALRPAITMFGGHSKFRAHTLSEKSRSLSKKKENCRMFETCAIQTGNFLVRLQYIARAHICALLHTGRAKSPRSLNNSI